MSFYRLDSPPEMFRPEVSRYSYTFNTSVGGMSTLGVSDHISGDDGVENFTQRRAPHRQVLIDVPTTSFQLDTGGESRDVREAHLNSVISSLSKLRACEDHSVNNPLTSDLCQILSQIGFGNSYNNNNTPRQLSYTQNESYSPTHEFLAGTAQSQHPLQEHGGLQYAEVGSRLWTDVPPSPRRPVMLGTTSPGVGATTLTLVNGNRVIGAALRSPSETGNMKHIYSSPSLQQLEEDAYETRHNQQLTRSFSNAHSPTAYQAADINNFIKNTEEMLSHVGVSGNNSGLGFDQNMMTHLSLSKVTTPNAEGSHYMQYSRKVFVGGLPPDIDEIEIAESFSQFGTLAVDWPHKAESKTYFPPKGYCFVLFQLESSVHRLIESSFREDDKLYWHVSSASVKSKAVQIRPWSVMDAEYIVDPTFPVDLRKTIFVGGVPRPLRAKELAMMMEQLFGGVCSVGIDTDPDLRYPKGAARVAFNNQQSYIAAISAHFVQLQHADINKRVEVKPYVLDDQLCDECQGSFNGGRFAPYFCASVTCLQYYCELCWDLIHSRPGRQSHKPLIKEGADRARSLTSRFN